MKYLLVIGDGMADNPVPELGDKTPLQAANIPTMDRLAAKGIMGSVNTCPKPLPAGSEIAILSIFGCDPLQWFTGRSPMEAAALGIPMREGDACYRCNLVSMEDGEMPYEEKRILSHSAGSISGEDAIAVVHALNNDPEFAAALKAANMELHPVTTFRPLAVQHKADFRGIRFIPPHDHLGEVCGPLLPSGNERARVFADLQRLANKVLEHHPVTEARRAAGKMPANGVWFWAEGTAVALPSFEGQYGHKGAVVSAVPLCHGIGALRGLEMVEVEGATGELDTNYEGKMEATWAKINEYDFVCLHLEAPDECTHNGDLPGKIQSIERLDERLLRPLLERMDQAGMAYRLLLLSDHKTLTSTRGHDGSPVPFLLYDSRVDSAAGVPFDEASGEKGAYVQDGYTLLGRLFEQAHCTTP
jgi:2,3-bisphosphoglycerate-independent phosphoglycerate mutase